VAAVLARALSPDKAQRFASCVAMASALRTLVGRVVPAVGGSDLRALLERVVPDQIALEQRRIAELLAADHSGEVPRLPPEPTATPASQPTGTIAVGRRQATPTRRPWLGAAAVLGCLVLVDVTAAADVPARRRGAAAGRAAVDRATVDRSRRRRRRERGPGRRRRRRCRCAGRGTCPGTGGTARGTRGTRRR